MWVSEEAHKITLKMPKARLSDEARASIFQSSEIYSFTNCGAHFINSGVFWGMFILTTHMFIMHINAYMHMQICSFQT